MRLCGGHPINDNLADLGKATGPQVACLYARLVILLCTLKITNLGVKEAVLAEDEDCSTSSATVQLDMCQSSESSEACLEAELVEFLCVSEAPDAGIKKAMFGEDEVCSLHGPERPTEVTDVDGGMPAVIQLCETLRP